VHSVDGWHDALEPVVARYRHKMERRYFRGDAALATPEVYEFVEAEDYKYTIRLPSDGILQESIAWLLKRPVGRPPRPVDHLPDGGGHGAARSVPAHSGSDHRTSTKACCQMLSTRDWTGVSWSVAGDSR
jgi:Transposase DDE domain group 1